MIRPLSESTWPAFAELVERSVPAGFLFNGALSTSEKLGFTRDRKIGKHRWVVTKLVRPGSGRPITATAWERC